MRTTLTLDPDVSRLLQEEAHRRRQPFKQVVNDALRRGLSRARSREGIKPFRVEPHRASLQPGFDRTALNRLSDELEEQAFVEKAGRGMR